MKYLLGIILIGMVASCGNDSPEWIFRDGIKMNKSTGETYRIRNGKWIKIETIKMSNGNRVRKIYYWNDNHIITVSWKNYAKIWCTDVRELKATIQR